MAEEIPWSKLPFVLLMWSVFFYMSPRITLIYTFGYVTYFGIKKIFSDRAQRQ